MFSNLRTEGPGTNHLFLPSVHVVDLQNDLVVLVEIGPEDATAEGQHHVVELHPIGVLEHLDPLEVEPRLVERIRDEILASPHRRITFARFMERALTEPGLGYYVAGARKFGEAGDFVTAPEISPLFSRCLARQAVEKSQIRFGEAITSEKFATVRCKAAFQHVKR